MRLDCEYIKNILWGGLIGFLASIFYIFVLLLDARVAFSFSSFVFILSTNTVHGFIFFLFPLIGSYFALIIASYKVQNKQRLYKGLESEKRNEILSLLSRSSDKNFILKKILEYIEKKNDNLKCAVVYRSEEGISSVSNQINYKFLNFLDTDFSNDKNSLFENGPIFKEISSSRYISSRFKEYLKSTRCYKISENPLYANNGDIVGVFLVFDFENSSRKPLFNSDLQSTKGFLELALTKFKREADFNRSKMMAENNSRFIYMSQMTRGMAHTINNPLSIIRLRNQKIKKLLSKDELDIEKVFEMCSEIDKTVGRIADLIQTMKEISKSNTEEDQKVCKKFEEILEVSLTLLKDQMNDCKLDLEVEVSEELDGALLYCQSSQIIQLFVHILQNAIDALKDYDSNRWIKLIAYKEKSMLKIEVSNSGEKISSLVEKQIFNPFFSTRDMKKRSGLGLGLCRSIVDAHNGNIYLDSQSSTTKFVILLPLD